MPENNQDVLTQFSAALAERVAAARGLVAGIRMRGHSLRSGTLWRKDVVVASEQALPKAEEAEVVLADGGSRPRHQRRRAAARQRSGAGAARCRAAAAGGTRPRSRRRWRRRGRGETWRRPFGRP